RKNDLEKMVNAEKEGIDAKVKKSQADLEALRTKLQGLTPGSDEFFDTDNEYKLRANVLKASMDGIEAQLRHKVEKLTLQVLGEINDTIKAFGDKNGYDLILKGDGAASNLEAFQDRMLRAQTTAVLYRGKSMDVTGAIIDALNNPEHLKAVRK
ncbi:MAG TPA: OmpH family outer membrane protein, partial [Planctomycetota bacterium]|nr:OmpH family outer membrane protein [Planctomycetota bacterium]